MVEGTKGRAYKRVEDRKGGGWHGIRIGTEA